MKDARNFHSRGEKTKPIKEIFRDDIISGQFNTHGVSVEEDKDPCPVVCNCVPKHLEYTDKSIS